MKLAIFSILLAVSCFLIGGYFGETVERSNHQDTTFVYDTVYVLDAELSGMLDTSNANNRECLDLVKYLNEIIDLQAQENSCLKDRLNQQQEFYGSLLRSRKVAP
jgi:hypothetical protein